MEVDQEAYGDVQQFHVAEQYARIDFTEGNEACASEAGLNVGESPTRRVGLFATEHELNSVAARRG